MTALRVTLAHYTDLFAAPKFDPLSRQLERDPGVERALTLLTDPSSRDATTLEIVILGPDEPVPSNEDAKAAIDAFCRIERQEQERLLRLTRHRGRQTLWIGVPVLATCLATSTMASTWLGTTGFGGLLSNSFIIAGWVAMWRPAELLLYDWWPYRHRMRLLDRLQGLSVRVVG